MVMAHDSPVRNKLLAALPPAEYERLLPYLEPIQLSQQQILYEPNQAIDYAYFPQDGVIALFNLMRSGKRVQTTTVGNEGMVGVPLVLGTNHISMQAITQIPGKALRMPAEVFRAQVQWGSPLYGLLLRYVQTLIGQISQNIDCLRLHTAEERCCYLLCLTQDRIHTAELPLTQETLALMVGIRRTGLSTIATTLQRAGLIQYYRGKITILDRPGLEAAACDCYRLLREEFDRGAE